jgi:SAM-dependent methyltransferase
MRFDACAHTYDAHAEPQRTFAARVAVFAKLRPREMVVEFGAGTGALTRHLCAASGHEITATDVSPAMVSLGRAAAPQARWVQLDAFRDSLPPADLQVSSGLLQWARDPIRVIQNWTRALAPGGRMVHAFPVEPCLAEWRSIVLESPVQWRDETDWCDLFARAALRITRKQMWVEHTFFPSSLELVRSLHYSGVTSHPRLSPGRLRHAIRRYDASYRRDNGVIATWAWLAVEAVIPSEHICPLGPKSA